MNVLAYTMFAAALFTGYLMLGTAMHGFPGVAALFAVSSVATAAIGFATTPA